MFFGYSGHGKTTLLNHMVNAGKPQAQGILTLDYDSSIFITA